MSVISAWSAGAGSLLVPLLLLLSPDSRLWTQMYQSIIKIDHVTLLPKAPWVFPTAIRIKSVLASMAYKTLCGVWPEPTSHSPTLSGSTFPPTHSPCVTPWSANHSPTGKIWPSACSSTAPELKMAFTFLNSWKQKKNTIL